MLVQARLWLSRKACRILLERWFAPCADIGNNCGAGLGRYFEELDALLVAVGGRPNPAGVVKLANKYGMDMDFSSLPELMATHTVTPGG